MVKKGRWTCGGGVIDVKMIDRARRWGTLSAEREKHGIKSVSRMKTTIG